MKTSSYNQYVTIKYVTTCCVSELMIYYCIVCLIKQPYGDCFAILSLLCLHARVQSMSEYAAHPSIKVLDASTPLSYAMQAVFNMNSL